MFELEAATKGADKTRMFAEAGETAACIDVQYAVNASHFAALGAHLRECPPRFVITCARGSSDHAAVYARYLIETRTGIPVCASGPSVSSLYRTPLKAQDALCLAVSQSGRSPDLLHSIQTLKQSGAFVVALVNVEDSPLADIADEVLPLRAGPENAVAATKSFLASLAAIARLVAEWAADRELLGALDGLPSKLDAAWKLDWHCAVPALEAARSLFVLGRGIGYGAAREAALKLKETCALHAEAYSAAEVLHGPAALVRPGFPILAFAQNDATHSSMNETLRTLSRFGAQIFAAGTGVVAGQTLPASGGHPALEPMLMIQSFYRMANTLSLRRGYDPDRPPHLSKITETV